MTGKKTNHLDCEMMTRCIALAVQSGKDGEYPYGAIVCREGKVIAESTNRVAHERDVTRHAEVVAISLAQKKLGTVSLDKCMIYVSAEPCVYCSYAIRETRIGRVVYALGSPHMGGVSKWNVLADEGLSDKMPEVFNPPPEIVAGFMANDVKQALLKWNPLVWGIVMKRGLFVADFPEGVQAQEPKAVRRRKLLRRLIAFLRPVLFDRFGRWI
ncbi:MAG: nucleoside deaminase [Burkholderiales bacterium]